jgi:hypothetical protein
MTDMTEVEIALGRGPDEWALARVARSVAGVVDRRGWDTEVARELLGMLGVDDDASIKRARTGLAASRVSRARSGYASAPRATARVHRSFHLRDRPMPAALALVPDLVEPEPEPELIGPEVPLCRRGHPLVGKNVKRRPDRASTECRECKNMRKRRYRAEKGGRDGSSPGASDNGVPNLSAPD